MKRAGLVEAMANKLGKSQNEVKKFLNAFEEVIVETLAKGEEVNITGFGKFYVRTLSEREGKNPRTGEKIKIPATKIPAFSSGNVFKKAIRK